MKRKNLLIIAAAVLGAALVFFLAYSGSSPQTDDVVGTIGAAGDPIPGVEQAERYRAQQIDDAAVTLESAEIQELLQDDAVLRLVQDPAFQHAMRNDVVRTALQREELQHAISQAEFVMALAQARGDQSGRPVMQRQEVENFINRVFETNLAHSFLRNYELAYFLARNQELAHAIAKNQLLNQAMLGSTDLQNLFSSADAVTALAQLQHSGAFDRPAFQHMVTDRTAFQLMENTGAREAFFNQARLQVKQ